MATTLNPSEISELIKNRIEKVKLGAESRNEGTIVSVSDGIVRIHGLADAMAGEMIELPGNAFLRIKEASEILHPVFHPVNPDSAAWRIRRMHDV